MIHFCSGYLTFIWGKCKRSQHSIKWTIVAALNELQYSNNVECSDPCHCTGLDSRRLYWFISEEIWTPGILSQFLAYLIQILRVGWALNDCLVIVENRCRTLLENWLISYWCGSQRAVWLCWWLLVLIFSFPEALKINLEILVLHWLLQ